jgi:hypothetical protein
MAYQNKRGIPLAHGQYLRQGQIIGDAKTIATAGAKSKRICRDRATCRRSKATMDTQRAVGPSPRNPNRNTTA